MKFKSSQRIALFGTSADPPTIGHKRILEELSKTFSYTITYVSKKQKKTHKEDILIRSLLLKTLIKDLKNPKIIFNQKISSKWAIESIKKCKDIYNLNQIDFVIGSDLIQEIFTWKSFDKIIKEVNFFIIERVGYPIQTNTLKMLGIHKVNFETSSLKIPNSSSSMIRLNGNYSDLPNSLINIVKEKKLYISTNIVE